MEELYWRANKYSTLKDNIRAASQTVMITASGKPTTKSQPKQKESQGKSQKQPQEKSEKKRDPPQFTHLNISYDRLLPLIRDHPEFKWPPPKRANPDQRNKSLRCDYHRDQGYEINQCQGLKFMIKRLIREGHLISFIREPTCTAKTAPTSNKAVIAAEHLSKPIPTINFILGGPVDDQYQSKRQRQKMLYVASIRVRINTINTLESSMALQPIDGLVSFPPIDLTWIITPHYDALVLTLCINNFDVHRALVDPSSAAELLHLLALTQMKVPLSHLSSAGRVLSRFNGSTTLTVGDIALSVKAGPVTQQVLFSVVEDLSPYNAIIDRTWLHAMKAIPSTYHQTISYLTASGQFGLQGNKLAARQCYQLSVHGHEKDEEPDSSSAEAHQSS